MAALSGWGKGRGEWRGKGRGGQEEIRAWGSGRGGGIESERGYGDCEEGWESAREMEGSHLAEEEGGSLEVWVGDDDEC